MDLTLMKLIQICLKVAELVIGSICLGVSSYNTTTTVSDQTFVYGHRKLMSFITITAGFILPTFLLLIVQVAHERSAEKQRKSIFEILYNLSAVILHVAASTTLLSLTEKLPTDFPGQSHWRAGGVMGLIETGLYGASTVMSFIEYQRNG